MDDNVSTKSSESSINTSGEYEIVTDSITTTPIEHHHTAVTPSGGTLDEEEEDAQLQQQSMNTDNAPSSSSSALMLMETPTGCTSPTLAIANNRNISDLQHDMTDALRDLDLERCCSAVAATSATAADANNGITISAASNNNNNHQVSHKSLSLPISAVSQTKSDILMPTAADKNQQKPKSHNNKVNSSGIGIGSILPQLLSPKSDEEEDEGSSSGHNRVGHSVFYDCIDSSSPAAAEHEKQDIMKPEKSDTDEEVSDIDQGCTIFSGVTYLGASSISAPRSDIEVYRIMSVLNVGSTSDALKISISIPNCSEGLVVLHDAESNSVIATYEIRSIILYIRGPEKTVENGCFAFTRLQMESVYQCHVFRCHIPEAVNQVSACFQKAFQANNPASMTCSVTSTLDSNMANSMTSDVSGNPICAADYEFIVSLEIREKVAKNSYAPVPRDRGGFKLRANIEKELHITVRQTPNSLPPLLIERCFGVLLAGGKLVRQADMQLIDLVSMGYQQPSITPNALASEHATMTSSTIATSSASSASTTTQQPLCLNPYYIHAEWKVGGTAFQQLNTEAAKAFLTVAVDIVMRGIKEPVRFVIGSSVSIHASGESRIMDHFISKRPLTMRFYLQLKRSSDDARWSVASIDPSEEIVDTAAQQTSSNLLKLGMTNLSRMISSQTMDPSLENDCPSDYSSDGDEPLLSGTGEVSKDCPPDKLNEWDPILKEWIGEKRPKNLPPLVRQGVPEALREKVWQKLANVEGRTEMLDMYKTLITKETKCETFIQRDIHRTFPAHKLFKETGGSGQDALFKVSKAYAVYDTEVGYCQGLSFIAASLLLHMPEEDAFCVLVALMYDYGLRDLYKHGFEALTLRFYQLDRLIQTQLPKLHEHFQQCGIETHMYASQWFLTLFTARFPLCFVFHVLDVFLLDGVTLLFQVALTLLSIHENDLRQLDFEGILKYFRVTLPKKCRSDGNARRIMIAASERKIKKLKQYEEEFLIKKQENERMEKEAQIYENRFGDERRKLQGEIETLQQKLHEANDRAIEMEKKHTGIIYDYKQIIQRLEQDMTTLNETLGNTMNIVAKCSHCSLQIDGTDQAEHKAAGDQPSIKDSISNSTSSNVAALDNNKLLLNKSGKHLKESPLLSFDPMNERIRELEVELARAKLAHVEAECRNQDLNHKLTTAITAIGEMQTKNTWQPWFSKTLNTLQEKVTTRSSSNRDAAASAAGGTMHCASTDGSETNSPCSNQEFKAFASVGGSPKLTTKFQATAKLRNSIDSLRNIVVPLDLTTATSTVAASSASSTLATSTTPAPLNNMTLRGDNLSKFNLATHT